MRQRHFFTYVPVLYALSCPRPSCVTLRGDKPLIGDGFSAFSRQRRLAARTIIRIPQAMRSGVPKRPQQQRAAGSSAGSRSCQSSARGSQGTVYLAADTRLGRQVALKTVLPAFEARLGRQGVAALLQEARIVSALSHPNIVPLYDAGEDDGVFYLVFEYVEGHSLAALIWENGKARDQPCGGVCGRARAGGRLRA